MFNPKLGQKSDMTKIDEEVVIKDTKDEQKVNEEQVIIKCDLEGEIKNATLTKPQNKKGKK